MKQQPPVYRVRALWQDRQWVIGSPDIEGLSLHAYRFDEIVPLARHGVATLHGVRSSTFDVALQPVSLDDPELQWSVERALAAQSTVKAMADEAAHRTLGAVNALIAAGMYSDDAARLVGLSDDWERERRLGRFGLAAFDDDPWISAAADDDWGLVNPWERCRWRSEDPSYPARVLRALSEEVGGAPELAVLEDAPLPDEGLVCDGIDDALRSRVAEVSRLCDQACDLLFDVETRTACRRLVAHLATQAPKLFRAEGRAASGAGAVCWIVGKANRLFDMQEPPRIQDLNRLLAVQYAGARAQTFLREGGFEEQPYGRTVLGSTAFLVSAHRRRIIEMRDRYSATDHASKQEL